MGRPFRHTNRHRKLELSAVQAIFSLLYNVLDLLCIGKQTGTAHMYEHPSAMEPMLPRDAELGDMASALVGESARTVGSLHPITGKTLRSLLRSINSYYSNLIEGHNTHPFDIERAMRTDYSQDPAKRALQLESRAHIEIQEAIETRLEANPDMDVTARDFLLWIHAEFYQRLPESFREVHDPETGATETVQPGTFRQHQVRVGLHLPPDHRALDRFLERFRQVYSPGVHRGHTKLVAAAANHHRLAWIHPFLDRNGRVVRLFSDAYLQAVGLSGHGLWSVSRGLARQRSEYISHLAMADARRRNDYDGRGNLSLEGLTRFCRFFLATCTDQARFMGQLPSTEQLHKRLQAYASLRAAGTIQGPPLKKEASAVLLTAFLRGQIARGEAAQLTGFAERAGREVIRSLLNEGLLIADSGKGPVRLGLPMHAVGYIFPGPFPEDLTL